MEFQFVDEIIAFWDRLVSPIFFLFCTLVYLLLIIGKEGRNKIYNKIIISNQNEYVLRNGIYIPKSETLSSRIAKRINDIFDFKSAKPLINLFLIAVLVYGFHSIITTLLFNRHSLCTIIPECLFAVGDCDYELIHIWAHNPNWDIFKLYDEINKHTDINTMEINFLYTAESYLKMYVFLLLFYFIHIIRKRKFKCLGRVALVIICLTIAFATLYSSTMYYQKDSLSYKIIVTYSEMEQLSLSEEEYAIYSSKLNREKNMDHPNSIFVGYNIEFESVEFAKKLKDSILNLYSKLRESYLGGVLMDKKEQINYQNRYIAEKYDRFTATFPAGKKEVYREQAAKNGESLNAYINRLIEEDILRQSEK